MENNIKKCKNPKCVTNHEKYIKASFTLVNDKKNKYVCDFCSNETYLSSSAI